MGLHDLQKEAEIEEKQGIRWKEKSFLKYYCILDHF